MARSHFFVVVLIAAVVGCTACGSGARSQAALSDEEFWRLTTALSEPEGTFSHSENLVSNESGFAHTIRLLQPTGGVYIGVGPEQNFSFMARLRPTMAFIVDIRQENRSLHLLYKALFEESADRADFLSRLFSRERPAGLGPQTSVDELFEKFARARRSEQLHESNTRLVHDRLLVGHRLQLSPVDLQWVDHAFNAFYSDGPDIQYARARPDSPPGPSYGTLMTATDIWGESRSYLATEEGFQFLKQLQARNLIVPIVGDFAGPKAIHMAGDYVRQHGRSVEAFYSSNVEVYLNREQSAAFCANLAALPYNSQTWFIGSRSMRSLSSKLKSCLPANKSAAP